MGTHFQQIKVRLGQCVISAQEGIQKNLPRPSCPATSRNRVVFEDLLLLGELLP